VNEQSKKKMKMKKAQLKGDMNKKKNLRVQFRTYVKFPGQTDHCGHGFDEVR
jgi:hypothetical protein